MKIPVSALGILLIACACSVGCDSLAEYTGMAAGETAHEDSGHAEAGEGEGHEHHAHKIIVTSPVRKDMVSTEEYVCQIHSCQHISVRAIEGGYLKEIRIREGQAVKKGDLLFKVQPIVYQARVNAAAAEAKRLQLELELAQGLLQKGIESAPAVALKKAEFEKAQAEVAKEQAELGFTDVTAPFDGIVDRQLNQLGGLVEEGDELTTLSDNSTMWAYFNVPEKRYFDYQRKLAKDANASERLRIELRLADRTIFPEPGKIGAVEADFDRSTGNISFRADFPNPDGLLRNGQTGKILIHTDLEDALVIPQRAKYEILAKQYVYVVDDEGVVHQRDIQVDAVKEDVFVIGAGLTENDKIVLEGVRQVRDGDKVEYEYIAPEKALENLKFHAE